LQTPASAPLTTSGILSREQQHYLKPKYHRPEYQYAIRSTTIILLRIPFPESQLLQILQGAFVQERGRNINIFTLEVLRNEFP
jgi:hypothetical protein